MRIALVHAPFWFPLQHCFKMENEHELIWIAYDSDELLRYCQLERPDFLLLPLAINQLDVVALSQRIMREMPCHIVLLATNLRQCSEQAFNALSMGALDVIDVADTIDTQQACEMVKKKLRSLAMLHLTPTVSSEQMIDPQTIDPPASNPSALLEFNLPLRLTTFSTHKVLLPPLILIGASTGGPKSIASILADLPHNFAASIIIVQHIEQEFASEFIHWLQSYTNLPVIRACAGEYLSSHTIYIASSNDHLIINAYLRFGYTSKPENIPYRPSIDVLFNSVAEHWVSPSLAILLTGMGKDGAEGLLHLRQAGWTTVAQDESTSIVYGMPKAAKELGAAMHVLPLSLIAPFIIKFVHKQATITANSNRNTLDLNKKLHE